MARFRMWKWMKLATARGRVVGLTERGQISESWGWIFREMCVGFIRRKVLPHYFKIVLRIAVSCLFNRTFSNVKMNVNVNVKPTWQTSSCNANKALIETVYINATHFRSRYSLVHLLHWNNESHCHISDTSVYTYDCRSQTHYIDMLHTHTHTHNTSRRRDINLPKQQQPDQATQLW